MIPFSVLDLSPIVEGGSAGEALKNTLDLARHAERLGYKRYWLAEHHNMPAVASAATSVVIGHVAAGTRTIRVGAGGIMLPNHAPLLIAEQFGTLESLFPGRIDLGLGRAPGSDQLTARALAGPAGGSPEYFPQQVRDLLAWLSGELAPEHPFAKVRAMPTGDGVPEVWLLGSSDQSAALAAHFGTAFSFAHFINADGGAAITRAYAREFKPSPLLAEPTASIAVFVVCAETEDEAERLAKSRDLFIARLYTGRGGRYPSAAEAEAHPYTPWERQIVEHARQRRVAGTPAQCRERLETLAQEYGVDEIVVVTITETPATRLRSYELLARAFELRPR
jgi:luciferase family oxidoreductase group 1